jgi:threonyl-tRNA synthetase
VLPGSDEALDVLRHSTAHIMAEAVRELFPGVKVAIGPAIENGFYYDFDYERAFTPEDLPAIEEKMTQIIRSNLPFACRREPKATAREYFGKHGEIYKVELIDDLADDEVSVYQQGGFVDLCRGRTCPPPARWARSSFCPWPGPIGAATKKTAC